MNFALLQNKNKNHGILKTNFVQDGNLMHFLFRHDN
jgi:hypothetical protein